MTLRDAVKGRDVKEIIDHILKGEIEPVKHHFGRKIHPSLCAIIRKATAYYPKDRYQTVDDLSEDLRRYMGGLSVSARPDNLWDKAKRLLLGLHL